MSIIYEMFADLPRQGPGDDGSTRRAFEMLAGLPERPEILDVGCGAGAQTLALARLCAGRITAVDNYEPFLAAVRRRADAAGVGARVVAVNQSMTELTFPDESFDLIWSEGAIFAMGFRAGLVAWRRLLRPGGYLVVSELSWFCDDLPEELRVFWEACYPAVAGVRANVRTAEEARYQVVGTFPLPVESWWADVYEPLERKLPTLREKYVGDAAALAEVGEAEREIDMFRKYSDLYGYEFYVLRRP